MVLRLYPAAKPSCYMGSIEEVSMPRMSTKARVITRRAFLATLAVLAAEIGLGVVLWPSEQWHGPIAVAGVTTYLFLALFGIGLAGERWPALGDFTQLHLWVLVALVLGSAAAMIGYIPYPDPASLIVGPFVLVFLLLLGWANEKFHPLGF